MMLPSTVPPLSPVCDLSHGWKLVADPKGVPWLESPEGEAGALGGGAPPEEWLREARGVCWAWESGFRHRKPGQPKPSLTTRVWAAQRALMLWSSHGRAFDAVAREEAGEAPAGREPPLGD